LLRELAEQPGRARAAAPAARRVEDRIRQAKDAGVRNLACHGFATNAAWLEVVLVAADLICWAKLRRDSRTTGLRTSSSPNP
jgi:hypothetical protein